MATYYIDYKNGDNGGSGATGDPWKTLDHALDTAGNSDTIIVRGADASDEWYREYGLTIAACALTGLTIEADSGHTPVFVGTQEYTSWAKTAGLENSSSTQRVNAARSVKFIV